MIRHLLFLCLASSLSAQQFTQFATGLQFPQRLIFTPQGNIVVSEGGTGSANTGRVSIVDRTGDRRTLLEGLPSGLAHFMNPFGPTGLALDGRTLYLLLGEGDVMRGTPPNYGVNTDGPSSPLFASVLKFQFSAAPDELRGAFRLSYGDHWGLSDGYEIALRNDAGERATVEVLSAFRPLTRNVLTLAGGLRPSDPYGVALDAKNNALYIADASQETLVKVDTRTGRSQVLFRFEPFRRAAAGATTLVDNVPTSVCWTGDRFLIGLLSGGPFPPGEASVRSLNPGESVPSSFATGFTALTGMDCSRSSAGTLRVFTSEFTLDLSQQVPSGRIQVIEGADRQILASGVPLPTGLALDAVSGDLFVTTFFPGGIVRVPVQ